MSTRQKAQTQSAVSAVTKARTPSPSQSSSSSSSSSTSSSPSKEKNEEQERKEVPEERPKPQDPPVSKQEPAKQPSALYKLARRLSGKTTPEPPSKEAQETIDMPPPEVPRTRSLEMSHLDSPREPTSGTKGFWNPWTYNRMILDRRH